MERDLVTSSSLLLLTIALPYLILRQKSTFSHIETMNVWFSERVFLEIPQDKTQRPSEKVITWELRCPLRKISEGQFSCPWPRIPLENRDAIALQVLGTVQGLIGLLHQQRGLHPGNSNHGIHPDAQGHMGGTL